MVLCILCSTIIIEFSFGFYHHLEQKKIDGMGENKSLIIESSDPTRENVNKGSLIEALMQLDSDVLDSCIITFEGRFSEDKTDNPAIGNTLLVEYLPFVLNDKRICVAPMEEELKENDTLIDGRYFIQKDFDEQNKVCLANIAKEENYEGEEAVWAKKYGERNDGSYLIDGEKYTCIGHVDWFSTVPWVPITTVSDDIYVQRIILEFDRPITMKKYLAIKETMMNNLGEYVQVPNLDINEIDNGKFYNSLLLLCVALFFMSALVVSVLYQYVILKRKRTIVIYRLCGMPLRTARIIYVLECLFVSLMVYVLGTGVFHYVLLPKLSMSFEYIKYSYNLRTYGILACLYMLVSIIVLGFMIFRQTKENIKYELGEA